MWALGIKILPPPDWIAWILGVSDETLEFIEFQAISNTSQNHQNGSLRPPKDSKMVSKVVPETIQIMKTLKIQNLMKTIVFTILLRGWDIRKPLIFN